MNWGDAGLLALALVVFLYLLVALIDPDRFG